MISFPFHVWMSNKEFKYLLNSVKRSLIELRKMRNLKKKKKIKCLEFSNYLIRNKKRLFLLLILITVASILEMTSLAIIIPIINSFFRT